MARPSRSPSPCDETSAIRHTFAHRSLLDIPPGDCLLFEQSALRGISYALTAEPLLDTVHHHIRIISPEIPAVVVTQLMTSRSWLSRAKATHMISSFQPASPVPPRLSGQHRQSYLTRFREGRVRIFNELDEGNGKLVVNLISKMTVWQVSTRILRRDHRMRTQIGNIVSM
jgi:hypothetical protein